MAWVVRAAGLVAAALSVAAVFSATAAFAAAPSTQDTQYLQGAHQANMTAITAGQLAKERGSTASIRDLGTRLLADHAQLDSNLVKTAQTVGVLLPTAVDSDQSALLDRLRKASGAAFDSLFVTSQVDGHAAALAQAETETSRGSDPQVVTLATDATPVLRSDQAMLRSAATRLGIPGSVDTGSGGRAAPQRPVVLIAVLAVAGVGLVAFGLRRRYVAG